MQHTHHTYQVVVVFDHHCVCACEWVSHVCVCVLVCESVQLGVCVSADFNVGVYEFVCTCVCKMLFHYDCDLLVSLLLSVCCC